MRPKPDRPSRKTLAKLVKQGLTRRQIADQTGFSYGSTTYYLKVYGLKPVVQRRGGGRKRSPKTIARDLTIVMQIAQGRDVTAIAEKYGISTEQVYVIVAKNGMTRAEVKRAKGK